MNPHDISHSVSNRCDFLRQLKSGNRREFLQVGSLAGFGLSLGAFLSMRSAQADAKQFEHFEGRVGFRNGFCSGLRI